MSSFSRIYTGQVYHRRTRPKVHQLRYSVFSFLLDLSEIDNLAESVWLFSRNRFNLFSFHDRDFGENAGESLADYLSRKLSEANIDTKPQRILLSCYPRVLGYVFNPLSLFYCLDAQGDCFAVVHEVHNTFGERHCYVLPAVTATAPDESAESAWIHQHTEKALFVSPFAQMGMHYDFRLNVPGERQVIVIRASDEQGVLITASYAARQQAFSTTVLLRCFLAYPLLGAKVIAGIHWEALKLWRKGVPWFRHQPKRIGK